MANQLLEVWCDCEGFSLLNDGSPAMPSACFGHSATSVLVLKLRF